MCAKKKARKKSGDWDVYKKWREKGGGERLRTRPVGLQAAGKYWSARLESYPFSTVVAASISDPQEARGEKKNKKKNIRKSGE